MKIVFYCDYFQYYYLNQLIQQQESSNRMKENKSKQLFKKKFHSQTLESTNLKIITISKFKYSQNPVFTYDQTKKFQQIKKATYDRMSIEFQEPYFGFQGQTPDQFLEKENISDNQTLKKNNAQLQKSNTIIENQNLQGVHINKISSSDYYIKDISQFLFTSIKKSPYIFTSKLKDLANPYFQGYLGELSLVTCQYSNNNFVIQSDEGILSHVYHKTDKNKYTVSYFKNLQKTKSYSQIYITQIESISRFRSFNLYLINHQKNPSKIVNFNIKNIILNNSHLEPNNFLQMILYNQEQKCACIFKYFDKHFCQFQIKQQLSPLIAFITSVIIFNEIKHRI